MQNFGDPFLMRIGDNETLSQLKERIREKLPKGVSDEEYAKYKFHIVHPLRAPNLLNDSDVVASQMPRTTSAAPVCHSAALFFPMLPVLVVLFPLSSALWGPVVLLSLPGRCFSYLRHSISW